MNFKIFSLLLLCFLLIPGCITLKSNQSGRSLGKENARIYAGLAPGKFNENQPFVSVEDGNYQFFYFGFLTGLTEDLDIGFTMNSSLFINFHSKYQFLGTKESFFASSIGIDLGTSPFGVTLGQLSFGATIASYNSIHFNEYFALTLSPKFLLFHSSHVNESFGGSANNSIYGYSSGIIIGKIHQVALEYSQFVRDEEFSFQTAPQFSIGYIYNFKRK